jgi:hypothetical protein
MGDCTKLNWLYGHGKNENFPEKKAYYSLHSEEKAGGGDCFLITD